MQDQNQVGSSSNPNYIQKQDWDNYLNEDEGSEHIGYILATLGVVQELSKLLTIKDENRFKNAVQELVSNRLDMLDYAHSAIDNRFKTSMSVQ